MEYCSPPIRGYDLRRSEWENFGNRYPLVDRGVHMPLDLPWTVGNSIKAPAVVLMRLNESKSFELVYRSKSLLSALSHHHISLPNPNPKYDQNHMRHLGICSTVTWTDTDWCWTRIDGFEKNRRSDYPITGNISSSNNVGHGTIFPVFVNQHNNLFPHSGTVMFYSDR